MNRQDLELMLTNYRYGVQKVLPAYFTGKMVDREALTDELALVLHSRDEIEMAFGASPALWREYGPQVDELDRLLLSMSRTILHHVTEYTAFRQQHPRPRSHWWYYLDEIVPLPARASAGDARQAQPAGYWMPVVPVRTTPVPA